MKKLLLTLGVALSAVFSAQAFDSKAFPKAEKLQLSSVPAVGTTVRMQAPQKEGEVQSIYYSYAGDPESALGFNNVTAGVRIAQFMELPPELTTSYAGNQVTKLHLYTGVNTTDRTNHVTQYSVIIFDFEAGTQLYTQAFTVGTNSFSSVTVNLTTPLDIEAGRDYLIGYYCTLTDATDYTVVVDGAETTNPYGGIVGVNSGGQWQLQSLEGSGYGNNCVGVTIAGDNLPMNNVSALTVSMPSSAVINKAFPINVNVMNNGINDVNNIELTYNIGDVEPVVKTYTLTTPLASGAAETVTFNDFTYPTVGVIPVTVAVTKVNDVDNNFEGAAAGGYITLIENGFDKNMIVEEFTGTWCGWCPQGIAAFENLLEAHPDGSFIPVGVHVSTDPMKAKSWNDMVDVYWDGSAPSCVVNRVIDPFPNTAYLTQAYDYITNLPALAEVTAVDAEWADEAGKTIKIKVSSQYALDFEGTCPFGISLALLENEVGPYNQTNNYAGGGSGTCYGWEDLPSRYKMLYNHVARYLVGMPVIEGSVTPTVTANTPVDFEYLIDSSEANIKKRDSEHVDIVVYINNQNTGEVENALLVKGSDIKPYGTSAISDVIVDAAEAPVEYFDIQGRRIDNPSNGLYIRRQGSKTEKVVL